MAIQFDGELERKLQAAAARRGMDVESTVAALLRVDEQAGDSQLRSRADREEALRREFVKAMQDPLFVEDMEETMRAFEASDAETARMIDHD